MDVKLNACFLSVDDHDKAIAFYRDALGCEVRHDVRAYGMRWTTVGPPSHSTERTPRCAARCSRPRAGCRTG